MLENVPLKLYAKVSLYGGVAKRPKATVCKTVISWVRIPPPP